MTQKQAISNMLKGYNVFLTGAPGSGKTFILNKFISKAENDGLRVGVTATTGIAATHLKGLTIHSWAGIGIKDELTEEDKQRLNSATKIKNRYKNTDVLIIDEISMLQGFRLDMVNDLAKYIRKSELPFGGIQVILVGDFFQLPPISRTNSYKDFVFYSKSWRELELRICYLTEQHRQNKGDDLLNILTSMRNNSLNETDFEKINSRVNRKSENNFVTRLYSHNIDVDKLNEKFLDDIKYQEYIYEAESKGDNYTTDQLFRSILAPRTLKLKVGAEVMFVVNNVSEGYFNGSRGKVSAIIGGKPIVKLNTGRSINVSQYSWMIKENDIILAEVNQLPIRLAWAMTVHKSQGMSLDEAEIDLRDAFTPGMGYVALSRVRSINGLYLKGYNKMTFKLFKEVYDLDINLRFFSEASIDNKKTNLELIDRIIEDRSLIDNKILVKLIMIRDKLSNEDGSITSTLPDSVLEIIAGLKPENSYQLSLIDEIPRKVLTNFSDIILEAIWSQ